LAGDEDAGGADVVPELLVGRTGAEGALVLDVSSPIQDAPVAQVLPI
jgi:hypothetical protein